MEGSSASGASMSMDGSSAPNYFIDSHKANIKEKYHFAKKLAQGGFGVVYLAEDRQTKEQFAVKVIQKRKLKDYTTFINEINILKVLVSFYLSPHPPLCIGPSEHHQTEGDLGVERCLLPRTRVSSFTKNSKTDNLTHVGTALEESCFSISLTANT